MPEHSVRITFPNKESLDRFIHHMSDGESSFFEAEGIDIPREDQICGFEFAQGPDGSVMLAQTEADLWSN